MRQYNSGLQVPTCLRPPYAVSGTDLVYIAICLRAPYATSGADPPVYGGICPMQCPTDLAYRPTARNMRCPPVPKTAPPHVFRLADSAYQ
eukprot:98151-Rhodomonas_salina.1